MESNNGVIRSSKTDKMLTKVRAVVRIPPWRHGECLYFNMGVSYTAVKINLTLH